MLVTDSKAAAPWSSDRIVRELGGPGFTFTPTKNGQVVIGGSWSSRNLVRVEPPALARLTGGRSRTCLVHHACADSFVKLMAAWEAAGLLGPESGLSWDGTFNARMKRGHEASRYAHDLSVHTFGGAFDIGISSHYPYRHPAPPGEEVWKRVPIALEHGWFPGALFHGTRVDPGHFQWGVTT